MREMQEQELQETLANVTQGAFGKTSKLKSLSVDSCEMMLEDKDLFVKLAIDRREESEVYGHCLRTAQLAMAIAAVLGKSCENISDLGMGCLIARAGQSELAKELIEAPRALTDAEWLEVKKTPSRTFDLMEQCPDVPVGARQVAYQMFERWDGSGYPRGRVGTQIHPLSRIACVADAYVALTSGRPHRPPFSPYRAIEIILQDTRKGLFDPQAVRGLLQTVCLYPVGSRVRLSDNSRATVLRTNAEAYDRPLVQITHGPDGCSVPVKTVDLSTDRQLAIVDVIEEERVNPRQLTLAFEA
jgi:HD-GYP domain-containing protein (c-di-GMP phosphodiesterase class II)